VGRPKDIKKRDGAFSVYRKTKNLTQTSKITGIDIAQLSRWKSEEDWDGRLEEIRERVGEKMGLESLKQEQALEVASIDEYIHLSRLREISIMAMEAIESGEVTFNTMNEVLKALELYAKERRLVEGEPTERRETKVNISLGGAGGEPIKAVQALLAIAASIERDEPEERNDVIDIEIEDD
jgi:hypothetical protein